MRTSLLSLRLLLLLSGASCMAKSLAQETPQPVAKPKLAIVSPSRPTDSLGEVVYEVQGKEQQSIPVVPGEFLHPKLLRNKLPSYPESQRRRRADGDVTVEGVVALNGRFIDARAVGSFEPDFADSAIEATKSYRFEPATLDGKPVASLIRIVVTFRIR